MEIGKIRFTREEAMNGYWIVCSNVAGEIRTPFIVKGANMTEKQTCLDGPFEGLDQAYNILDNWQYKPVSM